MSDSVPLGSDRSDKIRLNVGGKHFVMTVGTLCKEESMLSAMFDGNFDTSPDHDADGEYFIDRNPKNFDVILDWLRTSRLSPTVMEKLNSNPAETRELCEEAEYYSLSSLQKHLSTLISGPADATSYPRYAMATIQSPGVIDIEVLRLLKDAGFELKSVVIRAPPNGTETLHFSSSKSLSDSTVSELADEIADIESVRGSVRNSENHTCRFSLI